MGITRSIEQYFVEHDDGEFKLAEPTDQLFGSLVNVASQRKSQSILYCTKPRRIQAYLGEAAHSANLAIVGQSGLPDVSAIESMHASLDGRSIMFLGDMDPVDLLVFAWLRFRLRSDKVQYVGVGSPLLSQLSLFGEASIHIPQAPSEVDAQSLLLEALPDLDEIVGPSGVQLLRSGLKIELEGALFGPGISRARFLAAVVNLI